MPNRYEVLLFSLIDHTFYLCSIVFIYFVKAVKPGENVLAFVDSVIDSSRYYVVRIKDPRSTRTTLLGIGFRERDDAFDLKNALNEYVKFINRMDLASQLATTSLNNSESVDDQNGESNVSALYLLFFILL